MEMEETFAGTPDSFFTSDESYDERPHIEPVYEAFLCPITKQLMKDPVTLENGQTFEREAIKESFAHRKEPLCPVTSEELRSTDVIPNVGLRKAIQEWLLRSEFARLKIFGRSISSGNSGRETMRALNYIEDLCKKGGSHRSIVQKAEVTPRIIRLLRDSNRIIRCKALEVLCIIAEDDEDKKALAYGDTVRTLIKLLNRGVPQEKERAVTLLCELSESESLSEKIGEITGAILVLIGIASNATENMVMAQKAEKTLENLEKSKNNVLQMAENGRLEPLLRLFVEGSSQTRVSMASHVGDMLLNNDMKVLVAQSIGTYLVGMMRSDDMLCKQTALKSLKAISSHESSAKLLIKGGILPPLVEDLFNNAGDKQLSTSLKPFLAGILADLVASGADFESIIIDDSSKTLVSEDILRNLLHVTSNGTTPDVGCKLLQVLVGLTNSPTTVQHVIVAIEEDSSATTNLIQLIEVPATATSLEVMRVFCNVSPFMTKELSTALCRHSDGLSKLLRIASQGNEISEEQVAAVSLLAELPDEDPELVESLLKGTAFNILIAKLLQIHRGKILASQLSTHYFEKVVRVLAKLTYALQDHSVVQYIRENDLAAIFSELMLLQKCGSEEVQMTSAKALANLSRRTRHLSHVPSSRHDHRTFPHFFKRPVVVRGLCKVHGGVCSLKETFCLLDEGVVDRLVACLDHVNEGVVGAAFEALSTLLSDEVNVESGALILAADARRSNAIVKILVSERAGPLHQQSIWAIERLLRPERTAAQISANPEVAMVLREAFRLGDCETRQIAERALDRIAILPQFSVI